MRAIVVREYGDPGFPRIEDVARPEPGPDEVLAEVRAVTVNRDRDQRIAGGVPHVPDAPPLVPGLDSAGVVRALGADVTGITPGDRVAKLMGATVIAGAGSGARVAAGRRVGADHGIDYRAADLTVEVMRLTGEVEAAIADIVPLERLGEAYQRLAAGEVAGKLVIDPAI